MADFSLETYRRTGNVPESGIAPRHLEAFRSVASAKGLILVVRRGKAEALPWIERDYPAKPPAIYKAKTSAKTGKVTCSAENRRYSADDQAKQAYDANYFVLEADGTGRALKARHPRLGELPRAYPIGTSEKNEAGQIVERTSGLALTSDYDLMGVIDASAPGRALTLVYSDRRQETPEGLIYERTNPLADRAIRDLNIAFGGRPRIMHGPHDLKFEVDENNEEGCTAFDTGGNVYFFPTTDVVRQYYREALGRTPVVVKDASGRTI